MALPELGENSELSGDFVQNSVIEAILPASPSVNFLEAFKSWNGGSDAANLSLLPFIPQRKFLLFDERLVVYPVVRTPVVSEDALDSLLSRLAISIEAHAVSTAQSQTQSSRDGHPGAPQQIKEHLLSQHLDRSEKPLFIIREPAVTDKDKHIYVVWKVDVLLGRPRAKIPRLAVYFNALATLRPLEQLKAVYTEDDYLPSNAPASLNLLEPFAHDPILAGARPRLSASRLVKVSPAASTTRDSLRPLKTGLRRLYPAAPAILSRVRFSRLSTSKAKNVVVAAIDFEATSFAGCSVKLEEVALNLSHGSVKLCADTAELELPVVCKPGCELTILYFLTPGRSMDQPWEGFQKHQTLEITGTARVLLSEDVHPEIKIGWRANVEFPHTSHSNPSAPDHEIKYTPGQNGNDPAKKIGIMVTVSGPTRAYVGEMFKWHVFVVNHSDKARRLGFVAIPKRMTADAPKHHKKASSSSIKRREEYRNDSVADAVVDDYIVYAMQKNGISEPGELLSLSCDVRVGPLAPSACYTAELQFVALRPGVLHVDAIRVMDLGTQEAIDIRDLPEIVAVENGKAE